MCADIKAKEFSAQFCFDEFWGFRSQTLKYGMIIVEVR